MPAIIAPSINLSAAVSGSISRCATALTVASQSRFRFRPFGREGRERPPNLVGGAVVGGKRLARRRPMRVDGIGQCRDAVTGRRGRQHHRRRLALDAAAGRREHRAELARGAIGSGPVGLVDDDEVRDLEQPGLDRLHLVPHLGHLDDDRGLGEARDLDLRLPGTDRLDEDGVVAGGVERRRGDPGRCGEPAELSARGHRAHEDVGVRGVVHHPDPVTEDRAAGVRRRRVDGQDADPASALPPLPDQRADERRLAAARRPGDADDVRPLARREELRQQLADGRVAALDPRQQPGERTATARGQLIDHRALACARIDARAS